jgi:hypothetical protein
VKNKPNQWGPRSVSILMVTFNRKDDVARCLDSLFKDQPHPFAEFLVIDNGSTDGTAELVASYPQITLTRWHDNQGLAVALKELVNQAQGEWLMFLDSDTIVPSGAITSLLKFTEGKEHIGAVAPRMIDFNGEIQLTARNFPQPLNGLFGRQTLISRLWPGNPITRKFLKTQSQNENVPFRCDWVAFAAVLVRSQVMATQAIDPNFFVYWVDTDFFKNIAKNEWEVWCFPQVEIIHQEHNRTGQSRSPKAIKDFHYGAFRYFYNHHGMKGLNPLLWVAAIGLFMRAGMHLTLKDLKLKREKH